MHLAIDDEQIHKIYGEYDDYAVTNFNKYLAKKDVVWVNRPLDAAYRDEVM